MTDKSCYCAISYGGPRGPGPGPGPGLGRQSIFPLAFLRGNHEMILWKVFKKADLE